MAVDTDKPVELLLFDFLTDQIAAAAAGSTLADLDLHDTVFQKITKERGLRISDAVSEMVPTGDGGIKEYGVSLQIVCFAKVLGKEKKDRTPALTDVWKLQKEVYRLLFGDPSLGGRVCDAMPDASTRSYDTLHGDPYAVANIPIVINRTAN